MNERETALQLYQRAIEIIEQASETELLDIDFLEQLGHVCTNSGLLLLRDDKVDDAIVWHTRAYAFAQKLANLYPGIQDFQLAFSESAEHLANALLRAEKHDRALPYFEEALEIRTSLNSSASTHDLRTSIVRIHLVLASHHKLEGRMDEAAQAYRKARQTIRELDIKMQPADAQQMMRTLLLVGYYAWENGATEKAIEAFQDTVELGEEFSQVPGVGEIAAAGWLGLSLGQYQLGQNKEARSATENAISLLHEAIAVNDQPFTRTGLCCSYFQLEGVLRRLGEIEEASLAKERAEEFRPDEPRALFELAKNYASFASLIGRGKKTLNEEDFDELDRYLDSATTCLEEAVAAGFDDVERIRTDPGLLSLRGRPRFQKLIATREN